MVLLLVAGIVVALDWISKFIVRYFFSPGDSLQVIKGVLYLTYIKNPGALFGLFPDKGSFFIPLSIVIVVSILFYYYKYRPGKIVSFGLGLELGGALGNLIDRLILGEVVDFIDFRFWPVFNFADSAITIGLIIMSWGLLREAKRQIRSS